MSNPFFYGNPVTHDQFIDRRRELRRITGRIVNQGQSTAVVGEPRIGKTSLLLYLESSEAQAEYYGPEGERLLFSYLDAHTLGGEFSQAQFWEYALCRLQQGVIARFPDSPLARAYELCCENEFGCFVLERLLAQVRLEGWRLVLLLDEFDVLLHHPVFNSTEFFGSLRSLASRSQGALALVIASRRSLSGLNDATQQLSRTGSPYFNFLDEITLGALPLRDINELLRWAGDCFTADDRRFIEEVAGGHPYLLQVAASALWQVYEDGEQDPNLRRRRAWLDLYERAKRILGDTWRLWPPETRRALAAVVLAQINTVREYKNLLERYRFDVKRRIHEIDDFGQELRLLKKQGFVMEDETIPGGWRVRPRVLLWCLADELVRTVRSGASFDGKDLLKPDKKQQLDKTVRAIGDVLREGVATLVKAVVEGTMDGMPGAR
jgi:hypothetical protein